MARLPLLVVLLVLLAGFYSCYNSFDPNRSSSLTMPALPWSDPATWTGTANISPSTGVPQAGDAVTIPSGVTVCVDVDTADLGMVNISGTLTADDTVDVELTADGIMVWGGGLLEIGTEAQPFEHKFIFTINGADPGFQTAAAVGRSDNGLTGNASMPAARGIMVMTGGSLSLVGAVPTRTKTKIDEHAPAGTRRLTLVDPVDWKQGDKIAIAITDYYGYGETEILEIAQDTHGQKGVKLTTPLQASRWGRLQYVTSSGMSLLDDRSVSPPHEEVPTYLDERAEVVHMTRNIVIRAPDDAAWANGGELSGNDSGLGFGVHTMIMRGAPVARANGVEFVRCGQSQRIERYGWHWHVMSYSGTGAGSWLGDLDSSDHYVKNCTFYDSANRAVNIHGTCGVEVDETYAVKIRGHAFFLEDGSEERNVITDCVAMDVYSPAGKQTLSNINPYSPPGGNYNDSNYDFNNSLDRCIKLNDSSASGFWITNPLNRVERNWGIECAGSGLWNSFAGQVFGLTAGVYNSSGNPIVPRNHHYTAFNDNVGHSNLRHGMKTRHGVRNEAGSVSSNYYEHNVAADGVTADVRPAEFYRNTLWKNNDGGYSNRVRNPHYENWVASDNHGIDFTGATQRGPSPDYQPSQLRGALMIGESLNNVNRAPSVKVFPFVMNRRPKRGVASYHFFLNTYDCTIVNYPLEVYSEFSNPDPGGRNEMKAGGGFVSGGDNYTEGFESYFFMPGFQLINSSAGFVSPPPYFNGYPVRGPWLRDESRPLSDSDDDQRDYIHHAIASAIEDFWGYWGPAGNYIVTNEPFFTHDMDPGAVPVDASHGSANLRDWSGHVEMSSDDGTRAPVALAQGEVPEPYAYSTPDRMFGMFNIRPRRNGDYPGINDGNDRELVMRFDRLDTTTLASVDEYIIGDAFGGFDFSDSATNPYWTNNYPGTGNPADDGEAILDSVFAFRSFGAMQGGYYKITFPGSPTATNTNLVQADPLLGPCDDVFSMVTQNLFRSTLSGDSDTDWVILCLPWDGATPPYGRYESGNFETLSITLASGEARLMSATGNSLSDVENSSDGTVMWHDTANDELWVKLVGGLTPESGWITPAERRSLTKADVISTTAEEYKRNSLFQIRAVPF